MQRIPVCIRPGAGIVACVVAFTLLGAANMRPALAEVDPTITLPEARGLALAGNLVLAEQALQVKAADGAARQARAWPNPEVGVEVEDFGGDLPAWSGSQTTWSVSQRLQAPMTRRARIAVAREDRRAAFLGHEQAKLDLLAEVDRRFGTLLAEQFRLDVARESERTADTLLAAVSSLVNAGEVSPIEEDRARADRSRASIQARRAETAMTLARVDLFSLWASPSSSDCRAEGSLDVEPVLPADDLIDSLDAGLPELAQRDVAVARSEAEVRAQSWARLPDLTLGAGTRRANGSGDQTWTALAAIELPLWDRHGGAVSEAVARAAQARVRREAARLRVLTERRMARDALAGSVATVRTYREFTRPEVRRAYDAVSEGYRRGKFPLMDLLDARRSLAEAEFGYIDALQALWSARVDLERLLGRTLTVVGGK
jgi:outer membrane protein, heavy metal efflux system